MDTAELVELSLNSSVYFLFCGRQLPTQQAVASKTRISKNLHPETQSTFAKDLNVFLRFGDVRTRRWERCRFATGLCVLFEQVQLATISQHPGVPVSWCSGVPHIRKHVTRFGDLVLILATIFHRGGPTF